MTIYGFDVNHYKYGVDVRSALSDRFVFLMAKLSEGATYRDTTFNSFWTVAKDCEALFAPFHYLRGDSSVDSQAKNAYDALPDKSLPLIVDIERTNGSPQPTMKTVSGFVAAFRALGGTVSNLLYLPGWYWTELGRPSVAGWSLWQSAYGSNNGSYPGDKAPGWTYTNGGVVSLLQYTSKGRIQGYAGDVDLNAFRGTREELAATGWLKDYKKEVHVPLSADDLAAIQKAVADTPIKIDQSGTTQPLQRVLRRLLAEPAPSVEEITTAVMTAFGSEIAPPYAEVKAAITDVLRNGVDEAPASP